MHGWLEPILDRFRISMNRLVWPKVMGISPDTLAINLDNKSIGAIGGFDWRMNFKWILDIDKHERLTNTSSEKWEPKKSVTTIGAVHAISKEFFMHLGMYDSGFGIWGGEDVELSLRVWMCGGEVEYVPCSSAFHMFKRTHSYEVTMKQYIVNTDRIAETWLDEYKRYYYRSVGDTKNRNYGNVSERVELRKKLGCKSFDWFIKNVYPDIEIPKEIRDTTMPPTKPPTKPPITMKTVEEAIVEFTQEPPTEEPTIEPTMKTFIRKVEATTVKKKIQNITKSQVNVNNTMN
jgi:polypeptide N-acetylgalactosaminyltransferase